MVRRRAEAEAFVAEFGASGLMRAASCLKRELAIGTLENIVDGCKADRSGESELCYPSKWSRPLHGVARARPATSPWLLSS